MNGSKGGLANKKKFVSLQASHREKLFENREVEGSCKCKKVCNFATPPSEGESLRGKVRGALANVKNFVPLQSPLRG